MQSHNNNLWAPWRIGYIQGLGPEEPADKGCFLCDCAEAEGDARCKEQLILLKDERGIILLNRYPYTNGHLLVAPFAHVGELSDLAPEQRHGLIDLADLGCRVLKRAMNPQGFNVGVNIGRCAGAGVPGHIHLHVVPRWAGDVNYMQTLGGVRVIPQAMDEAYDQLSRAIAAI